MRIVGILIAAIVAIAATYLAYNVLSDGDGNKPIMLQQAEQPDTKTANILVAARDIELGDTLDATAVESKPWPQHLLVEGFVTSQEQGQEVVGRVARSNFVKGEPINMQRLSNIDEPGFIAARLPEGMRMVTISSDNISGLAGFVYPGDRVDVMMTRKFPLQQKIADATGARDMGVTETLLRNIRVLAVNQRAQGTAPAGDDANAKREAIPNAISLEVSVEDTAKLRLGQEVGYLSLALRSLKDKDAVYEPVLMAEPDITSADDEGIWQSPLEVELEDDADVVSVIRGTVKTETKVPTVESEVESEENPVMDEQEVELE